tara:strand:- start:186 stop:446 length:261 start_codon:yes stop_codon:yes gene_type:complete
MSAPVNTEELSTGGNGGIVIVNTDTTTPPAGAVFAAITSLDAGVAFDISTGNIDLTTLTSLPAGTTVFGRWTSLKLSGGQAVVYYA